VKQHGAGFGKPSMICASLAAIRNAAIIPMHFMAEQAAQKALKGFLMAQGQRSVPVHSVAQLAERCAQFDADFAAHITSGRLLDQYYIPTRYPDALAPPAVPFESYTQEQGERAVAAVQAIVALVRQKVPFPNQT
jgi:HEPN domain-containing protein